MANKYREIQYMDWEVLGIVIWICSLTSDIAS